MPPPIATTVVVLLTEILISFLIISSIFSKLLIFSEAVIYNILNFFSNFFSNFFLNFDRQLIQSQLEILLKFCQNYPQKNLIIFHF